MAAEADSKINKFRRLCYKIRSYQFGSIKMQKEKTKKKKIEEEILKIAFEIAKKGEGSLFVIGDDVKYSTSFPELFEGKKLAVEERGTRKILEKLATIDGAVVISKNGFVNAYGARIKNPKVMKGYGTRHAAALGASEKKQTVIMTSEEDKVVRIFKDGKMIMELNPKKAEKEIPRVMQILSLYDIPAFAAFLGASSAIVASQLLGLTPLPGVLVFGSSYYAIKALINMLQKIKK